MEVQIGIEMYEILKLSEQSLRVLEITTTGSRSWQRDREEVQKLEKKGLMNLYTWMTDRPKLGF